MVVKLDRIYTRGGDGGKTSLGDGARVEKYAPRVHAMGDVDEANAVVGLARLHMQANADAVLARVQNDLFDLGADLCRPEDGSERAGSALRITEAQVTALEADIDRFNDDLEPLTSFVLPGGTAAAAALHHGRTVVRRAERRLAALAESEPLNRHCLAYLNRLSDLLFVLARHAGDGGRADILWRPGGGESADSAD